MDVEGLENAINSAKESAPVSEVAPGVSEPVEQVSREEEVGFHKGAFNTLMAERNELLKMIGNVEAIASAHIKRLEELGVKVGEAKK